MTHLVLDIETVLDPEIPFEPKTPDEFPPFACWSVATIGYATFGFTTERMGVIGGDSERDIVGKFLAFLERNRPTLVTWNGRGFDMGVISMRALRYGIPMAHWYSDRNTRYRYSTDGHWDLKDFLSDFGAGKVGHLDQVARLVGFPGKVGVDGSKVAGMLAEGRKQEVDDYCVCDVVQTAAVFLRSRLLRAELTLEEYRFEASKLLTRMAEAPAVKPVLDLVDRKKFLLEESLGSTSVATTP